MEGLKQRLKSLFSLTKEWLNTDAGMIFMGVAAIPSLLTAIYLFVLAPDRYVSTSLLSVYDSAVPSASNDVFSSLGITSGQSNTDLQLLEAYLHSPQLLHNADEELAVKAHYSDTSDFLFGLDMNAPVEDFHSFYQERVLVQVNQQTRLLTITTEGYTPEFALKLNQFLIQEGERVINRLNQDVARTEMGFAEEEIARSLNLLKEAQTELARYQSREDVTIPQSEGESILSVINGMEASLAETRIQLNETLTFLSPDSPQARSLSAKISALETQIEEQKSRIIGASGSDEALTRLQIEYNELLSRVELAKVVYEAAVSSYEISRSQSTKKLKHLLIPSPPALPEKPELPERSYWWATLTLIYLALFGIVKMVQRSIREHQD
jgi:capsular polysaccharide transport system permease protein